MSDKAMKLYSEVAALFGMPITVKPISDLFENTLNLGQMDFESDKSSLTPLIEIDSVYGRTESTFTHELLHLKNRAMGFPHLILYHYTNVYAERYPTNHAEQAKLDMALFVRIFDAVEHQLVFEQMKDLNISNPKNDWIQGVKEFTSGGVLPITNNRNNQIRYYFKNSLELPILGYGDLMSSLKDAYTKRGWSDALTTSEAMVKIAKNYTPVTKDNILLAVTKAANLISPKSVQYEIINTTKRKSGNATITVCELLLK